MDLLVSSQLTEFMQSTVMRLDRKYGSHRGWVDTGGTGTITRYQFQDHCLLVVSQPEEVHEQIAALLAALRRCAAADAKPGNEMRLPQRPKTVAPTVSVAPGGSTTMGAGGGFF